MKERSSELRSFPPCTSMTTKILPHSWRVSLRVAKTNYGVSRDRYETSKSIRYGLFVTRCKRSLILCTQLTITMCTNMNLEGYMYTHHTYTSHIGMHTPYTPTPTHPQIHTHTHTHTHTPHTHPHTHTHKQTKVLNYTSHTSNHTKHAISPIAFMI